MTSQLQIALISKCVELPGWDWTHTKDFLKLFLDFTNFFLFFFNQRKVIHVYRWMKTHALGSIVVDIFDVFGVSGFSFVFIQ